MAPTSLSGGPRQISRRVELIEEVVARLGKHDADALPAETSTSPRTEREHVDLADRDRAAIRTIRAREQAEQGRRSRARRSCDHGEKAARHIDIDFAEREDRSSGGEKAAREPF